MTTKFHAGTHRVQGRLTNKGTAPKPNPYHGGSGAPRVVHDAAAPPPPRSWHAMAAASQKRKS
jgi:hypothetical protein